MSAVSFPIGCLVVTKNLVNLEIEKATVTVTDDIPSRFPILITWQSDQELRAATVYHRDLEEFTANLKAFSYLVPEGQAAYLNKALAQQSRSATKPYNFDWESAQPWSARFKIIEQFPDGSQRLEVESTWDDDRDNVGWYTAHRQKIVPERYLSVFGPGLALGQLPIAILITSGIYIAGFIVVHRVRKRRKRQPIVLE